jgi:hypothetical protein
MSLRGSFLRTAAPTALEPLAVLTTVRQHTGTSSDWLLELLPPLSLAELLSM